MSDIEFADDLPEEIGAAAPSLPPVKVLIVDDEPQIHRVTRLVLGDINFRGHPLEFFSAYTAREALQLLKEHSDIGVVLLDVVMETEHAGLDLVQAIRQDLGNTNVRIILRTGQPGQAPEREVVDTYDINDYRDKAELTSQKLESAVRTALRGYYDLMTMDASRQGLQRVIEAISVLSQIHTLDIFLANVLVQLGAVLGIEEDGLIASSDEPAPQVETLQVLATSGRFAEISFPAVAAVLPADAVAEVRAVIASRESHFDDRRGIVPVRARFGRTVLMIVEAPRALTELDQELIDVFIRQVGILLANLS